ncbi:helix-turn-helix domain-containing protein [Candidatus Micrarchaeota archaeon]|nr:helix-turn-helix domain-containing protein [Candidatus Micrarchaeota archaeon]
MEDEIGSSLKSAIIKVYHQDCPASRASEKFPHIRLEQLSPVVCYSHKPKSVDYKLLWGINAEKPSELDEFLTYLKRNPKTRAFYVLDKNRTRALAFHSVSGPNSSYEKALAAGAICTKPIDVQAGFEIYPVLASDPSHLEKILKELSSVGQVHVSRIGNYKGEDSMHLTQKQMQALSIALQNNYYDWPRKSRLDDLAKVAGISRRSLQERLRRAESKLIPHAAKEFLKRHF